MVAGSNGDTLRELLSFLKVDSVHDLASVAYHLADYLFVRDMNRGSCLSFPNELSHSQNTSLKPSFKMMVKSLCSDLVVAGRNLKDEKEGPYILPGEREKRVAKQIDTWMMMYTNDHVRDAFHNSSISFGYRDLVFLNALCFKGEWKYKFPPSKTDVYEFHLGSDVNSVKAPCMTSNKKEHLLKVCDGFKVLGLPYMHCFKMYIFLPDSKDGLPSLVEKVFSQYSFLDQNLPKIPVHISEFGIPKFKFSYQVMASDLLKELGLILPFESRKLTKTMEYNIAETISSIFQKAFIEVNEEGTEVTAASAAIASMKNPEPPTSIDFVVDHPFIFLIREDITGAVLFAGQVINPLVH